MDSSLKSLVAHIEAGIKERDCRTVFDDTLSRHWPCFPAEMQKQATAIKAFARTHGWSVAIHGHGQRATFTKP